MLWPRPTLSLPARVVLLACSARVQFWLAAGLFLMSLGMGSGPRGASGTSTFRPFPLLRWHPDGTYLLMDEGVLAREAGRKVFSLSYRSGKERFAGADWSPDGTRVAVALPGSPRGARQHLVLYPWRAGTSTARRLVSAAEEETHLGPSWEPGGTRIAFVTLASRRSRRGDWVTDYQLRIADARSGNTITLVSRGALISTPLWSPRGRRLLLRMEPEHDGRVALLDVTAKSRKTLVLPQLVVGGYGEPVSWAPDGSQIAFAMEAGASPAGVGLYDLRSGRQRRLGILESAAYRSSDEVRVHAPAWSPDGKTIACVVSGARRSGRDGDDIHFLRPAGTGSFVALRGQRLWSPSWSPDGRWLAVWESGQYRGREGRRLLLLRYAGRGSVTSRVRFQESN
jgi:Tol biopolymer transport system component